MLLYATVSDPDTGEVLERLGPFETAHEARRACGQAAGELLIWQPAGDNWEACAGSRLYQVPRETTPE